MSTQFEILIRYAMKFRLVQNSVKVSSCKKFSWSRLHICRELVNWKIISSFCHQ